MNTEQAFVEGFVKRASEYGVSHRDAITLLEKTSAGPTKGIGRDLNGNEFDQAPSEEELAALANKYSKYSTYGKPVAEKPVNFLGEGGFRNILDAGKAFGSSILASDNPVTGETGNQQRQNATMKLIRSGAILPAVM